MPFESRLILKSVLFVGTSFFRFKVSSSVIPPFFFGYSSSSDSNSDKDANRVLNTLTVFSGKRNDMDMVEVCWDYGPGEVDTGLVKLEPNSVRKTHEQIEHLPDANLHIKCNADGKTQCHDVNKSPSVSSTGQSGTCIVDQEKSQVDDTSPCSMSPISATPVCRQFWKAGVYNEELTPASKTTAGSRINIHPKFLHTNATSHKWAFGAIAELLDNTVDEVQNGATYVCVDKIVNPRNGSPALLIQDDGGGMNPEAMRQCLSFGFSDKKSDSAIGKYGNGFKTSSMRLGADAIVFSRKLDDDGNSTQSIGLLSYTFLTESNYDRIVVPMVHYRYNYVTGRYESLQSKDVEHTDSNLSVLLKWSPFTTEKELLKQLDDIGYNGTKIIIYNLWLDDEGNMELDFESDPQDIRIRCIEKSKVKEDSVRAISENHIASRLQYSLRAYLSILYLKLPETFCIALRKEVVTYYNIATDLKHPEFISYKAHSGGSCEGSVVTTIGFLKEAPDVKVHGFNIYHKRRLILPFLPVIGFSNNKGRGVVGVLEANFIEPTHNKQDFEKTNVYQKLVNRLKEMTSEYWEYHCGLIGYKTTTKRARAKLGSPSSSSFTPLAPSRKTINAGCSKSAPVITTVNSRAALNANSSIIEHAQLVPQGSKEGSNLKRKLPDQPEGSPLMTVTGVPTFGSKMPDDAQKKITLMQENKNLHEKCLEFEKAEEELNLKVTQLKTVLQEAQREYASLLKELQLLESVKGETNRYVYV